MVAGGVLGWQILIIGPRFVSALLGVVLAAVLLLVGLAANESLLAESLVDRAGGIFPSLGKVAMRSMTARLLMADFDSPDWKRNGQIQSESARQDSIDIAADDDFPVCIRRLIPQATANFRLYLELSVSDDSSDATSIGIDIAGDGDEPPPRTLVTLRYDESLKAWLFVDETQGIDFRRLDRSRPLERGAWSSVVLKKQGTLYYVEVNSESIATFEGPDVQAATLRLCQFITPANVDRRTHVS